MQKETPTFRIDGQKTSTQIVVYIDLPQLETMKDVDLDVTDSTLELTAILYELKVVLPGKVDPDTTKAKWLKNKKQLKVVLSKAETS